MEMIYDTFSYNGEVDILEIRLNILYDFVDKFVIIEAGKTFAGQDKPYLFDAERFRQWGDKIVYYQVDEPLENEELYRMALESPLTGNKEEHWIREYVQKELPREALKEINAKDGDIIFFGDCDEIWNPKILDLPIEGVKKIKQFCYYYYLNQRVNEEWWGTSYGKYGEVKNRTFNDWRGSPEVKMDTVYGWHFTYQGGNEQLKRKVTSCNPEVCFGASAEELLARIDEGKDLMNRNFQYQTDEHSWPEYLKENKVKYQHLL